MYLIVDHESGYIEEKNGNKYLIFEALLKIYANVWDGIKNEVKAINGGKEIAYDKNFMSIKFNSDDDLLLNKRLKFHAITIIIGSIFEEGGKLYPQVLLDDTLYES